MNILKGMAGAVLAAGLLIGSASGVMAQAAGGTGAAAQSGGETLPPDIAAQLQAVANNPDALAGAVATLVANNPQLAVAIASRAAQANPAAASQVAGAAARAAVAASAATGDETLGVRIAGAIVAAVSAASGADMDTLSADVAQETGVPSDQIASAAEAAVEAGLVTAGEGGGETAGTPTPPDDNQIAEEPETPPTPDSEPVSPN